MYATSIGQRSLKTCELLIVQTARPDSSGGWVSPSRLIRTLSSNNTSNNNHNGSGHNNNIQSMSSAGSGASVGAQREDGNGMSDAQISMDPLSQVCHSAVVVMGQYRYSMWMDVDSYGLQHILRRTHTPLSIQTSSARPRTADSAISYRDDRRPLEQTPVANAQDSLSRTDTADSTPGQKDSKKGTKAVSFLSRLIGTKKKEVEDEVAEEQSEGSEERPEGNNVEAFAQPFDNMGFNPHQPQPPPYIKVRSKHKKERDFDRVFLAQELQCGERPSLLRQDSSHKLRRRTTATTFSDSNTVWAMEFSKDGQYLAAAGADTIVRVWAVLASSDDRLKHERQESNESEANGTDAHSGHLSAPVFQRQPVREYHGHTSTVLDLSWSKNNFLLSSSMDKTVRLWHISRAQCLCTFQHNDFVPSIAFHPKDDRFFLAGSLDSKLRLWSIPDKSVAFAAQVPEMITAVAFTPDGKYAMAGCLAGLCMFYETEGLRYQSRIHVRSTRGHNANGSKITGIQAQYSHHGEIKVLITSNDSRIRLYNFRDKSLELKLRGNENNCSQIRATLSDDGKYVICGSEDRKAYIWSLDCPTGDKRDRTPVEMFETHNSITTVVCFAPVKTRQHLSRSEDPVYEICNPAAITLLSQAERADSQHSSRPATGNGSMHATPSIADGRYERPKESPGYTSRCAHKGGNIIVAADYTGKIKVFRQDCAWSKRKADDWDRASIFTRRSGKLSRTASMATRASQKSYQDSIHSTSTQAPSERIISWRQGISSTQSFMGRRSSKNASRSTSPRKSVDGRTKPDSKSVDAAAADIAARPLQARRTPRGTSSRGSAPPLPSDTNPRAAQTQSPLPPRSADKNPLALSGDQSYLYWDMREWKNIAAKAEHLHRIHDEQAASEEGEAVQNGDMPNLSDHLAVRPPLYQVPTLVSQLSDERSSADETEGVPGLDDQVTCPRCQGKSFTAHRSKKGTKVVCSDCGAAPR